MINAGKYNRKIEIYAVNDVKDSDGFIQKEESLVLKCWAAVKTTKGWTLITNGSDFEAATTNFTIRYTQKVKRNMQIHFNGKIYDIEYLNDIDEKNIEIEMQCKEVTK